MGAKTYQRGSGENRKQDWKPIQGVYFKRVEKRKKKGGENWSRDIAGPREVLFSSIFKWKKLV